jgi:hypothetical protein
MPDEYEDEEDGEEDEDTPDDLCDLCYTSHVSVSRTTYCDKTIGIECGCDERHPEGFCGDPDCEECNEERTAQVDEDADSAD